MENLIGSTLQNRFKVLSFVASGGTSTVYQAWDTQRNVTLAMKVLHLDPMDAPSASRSFQREARALQRLAHPNIVPFYGLFQEEDLHFLLELFVDGPSLKTILHKSQGRLPIAQVLIILKSLGAALGYAHANGVVHCDVKPGNVMIDCSGQIFLTDFGVARHADSTTTTIGVAGTPAYMAPEQIRGEPVSAATDVYALGVLLFEMLTGRRPFTGAETDSESSGATAGGRVWLAHLTQPAPDPRNFAPELPASLAAVVLVALQKDARQRYQSTQQFFAAVCEATGNNPANIPDRLPISMLADFSFEKSKLSEPVKKEKFDEKGKWLLVGLVSIFFLFSACLGFWGFNQLLKTWWSTIPKLVSELPETPENQNVAPGANLIHTPLPVSRDTPTAIPSQTPLPKPTNTPTSAMKPAQPDDWIAFTSDRSGSNEIYIMQPDGSQLRRLTFFGKDSRIPNWSPDHKWITFQSTQDGDVEVYILPIDKPGNIQQLTRNRCNDYSPVWSPDGNRIAFYSDCDGNREIYIMNRDGSQLRQLTFTDNVYNWFPVWSPDGKRLAFASNRAGSYSVYLVPAAGGEANAIAKGCIANFSPDGKTLVFTTYCTDLGNLHLIDLDSGMVSVLDDNENSTNPCWSADGEWIIFQSDRSGNDEIWMINVDSFHTIQLTFDPGRDGSPDW